MEDLELAAEGARWVAGRQVLCHRRTASQSAFRRAGPKLAVHSRRTRRHPFTGTPGDHSSSYRSGRANRYRRPAAAGRLGPARQVDGRNRGPGGGLLRGRLGGRSVPRASVRDPRARVRPGGPPPVPSALTGWWERLETRSDGRRCPNPFVSRAIISSRASADDQWSPRSLTAPTACSEPTAAAAARENLCSCGSAASPIQRSGGEFSVKKYESTKGASADGDWSHREIRLKSLNPDPSFRDLVFTPDCRRQSARKSASSSLFSTSPRRLPRAAVPTMSSTTSEAVLLP